eukprot:6176565-Pleurochrysis_carterae.AAC.6
MVEARLAACVSTELPHREERGARRARADRARSDGDNTGHKAKAAANSQLRAAARRNPKV